MTDLESALCEAAVALEACSIPFMLIGGLAVAAWGEARSTLDVDLAVWADATTLPSTVECVCRQLKARTAEPVEFVKKTRVLPLESASGIRLDVVFGSLPIQREALARAVRKPIAGRQLPVVSVEDLILMKLISERQKDTNDAHALLKRFATTLDRTYLLPKLDELAEALARPDILRSFRDKV